MAVWPIKTRAAAVRIHDAGGYYTGIDVEAALQEIGAGTANIGYLKLDCSNDPLTAALDLPELYNSFGSLKIMPDVQGNVDLFGDTDVANDADGKRFTVSRRAAEGDTTLSIYGRADRYAVIDANWDIEINSNVAAGRIKLGAVATNIVNLLGSTENSVGWGNGTDNPVWKHYGYITAGGLSGQRYVQYQVDDTDDYYWLTGQTASILGFKIDMPVNLIDNSFITTGTLGAGVSTLGSTTITSATDVVPLTLKGGGAGTSNLQNWYNKDNVLVSYHGSSGSQVWYFGGALTTYISYTTPAGYPGIVGTYNSANLWVLGGKSGMASWGRAGEYGLKHYSSGYMELGNSSDSSLAYAQLFINNSVGTTKRVLALRAAAGQTGNILEALDLSNNILLNIGAGGELNVINDLILPPDADATPVSGSSYWDEANNRWYIYNDTTDLWKYVELGGHDLVNSFANLSDYPANAEGALTNDGAGNLSWAAGGGGLSQAQILARMC